MRVISLIHKNIYEVKPDINENYWRITAGEYKNACLRKINCTIIDDDYNLPEELFTI